MVGGRVTKYYLYLMGLLWLSGLQANLTVDRFFEHLGQKTDKLVFYFHGMPKLEHTVAPLHDEPEHYRAERFIFHKLHFANDQVRKLLLLNSKGYYHNGHHQCYKLKFKQLEDGLELILIYDLRQVQCVEYHSFKAISGFDGFLIQINHKLVGSQELVALQNQEKQPPLNLTNQNKLAIKNRLALEKYKLNHEITIGLDYGHGGTDQGAMGLSAQPEKIITRQVGFKLKKLLVDLGYNIIETCPDDLKMDLDERTYLINFANKPVDLLISIHANYAANSGAMGLETFFSDQQLFKTVVQSCLMDQCQRNSSGETSKKLANIVHETVLELVNPKIGGQVIGNYNLKDRKVRCSAAQILLGVECPAILIELGYLSNLQEAKKLNEPAYQEFLAQGIAQGVVNFLAAYSSTFD